MLQDNFSSNKLILPAIKTKPPHLDPKQRWKRAERRVTAITFPRFNPNRHQKVEKRLPVPESPLSPPIEASLISQIDYFQQYLRDDASNTRESNELDKFLRFCNVDDQHETYSHDYFVSKNREILKQKQLDLIENDSLMKSHEVELFDQLAGAGEINSDKKQIQKKTSIFEKNYHSLIRDFAKYSFEFCSVTSMEIFTAKNNKNSTCNNSELETLITKEMEKERTWIQILDEKIMHED
uniref:Uncharacterized protein n=1 Tax=Panagrolaimus sp. JU765 TaxID=591449 RepID=A0AC34Q583_9BILA